MTLLLISAELSSVWEHEQNWFSYKSTNGAMI